ncbi:MAG: extracellular solute-binding protein [Anaerolineae bacterium]|nr:extracellular solute-binding protein [Anaerolineae bacterium]
MKTNFRLRSLVILVVVALALLPALSTVKAQDKTVVTWFIGLGTGTQAQQLEAQKAVADAFNASQDKIELQLHIAANNQAAPDELAVLLQSPDTAPDIVGPTGFSGANAFAGSWMDIRPLVEAAGYDLKQFPESLVNLYEAGDEGLLGVPFAVYPGVLYYNKDLFDEAGLAYPPNEFGAKYELNGAEVDWSWDTVAEVAKILTVDANGNDATSADFDAAAIEQYGFVHQWAIQRSEWYTFGGFEIVGADGKVVLPESARAETQWVWNGIWKDHFIPSSTASGSALLQPSEFASGKVGMARVMLWYTCCLGDLKSNWDIGVVPSYNGTYYAPADADTFRILKSSKNPEAAFEVMQYLLGDGALQLLTAYGAFPARADIQESFVKALSEKYPSVTNWQIIQPSLEKAPSPHHESYVPNYNKVNDRLTTFRQLVYGDTGKDLDVNAELDKLQADLQTLVDEK